MYPDSKQGQGATLSLASGYTAEITEMTLDPIKFEKVDVTKLSSSNAKEYIQSALYEPGGLTAKIHYNPDNTPALSGTASTDTVTIFYPPIGTAVASNARSRFSVSAFLEEIGHSIPLSGKLMEGTIKIAFTGAISHTATS